ncbi:hypothetical protein NEOLEDRAFT_1128578 [Neolentinus lepideus HHB14362 ss-1]|uniref:Uncharacterized protein n=1 Tax=Neolentinus lepideus HHB14362 ss-1 TaxID=1314782 RepID=A0A165V2F2_9AGAM|nr:hypothetical protein NEOLEDRAFT_1128578 [Neolentinus lepideus HHB14362 ss-1]
MRVPSFDGEVEAEYILHLANWLRCNDCWNFESSRSFGKKGLEIQKTHVIPLMLKVQLDPTGHAQSRQR